MEKTKELLYKLKAIRENLKKEEKIDTLKLNWFEMEEHQKMLDFLQERSSEAFDNLVENLNGDGYRSCVLMHAVECLPEKAVDEILTWDEVSKSPYSNSFYNSKDIDWDYKPVNSLRISDHWNFVEGGEDCEDCESSNKTKHCQLTNTDEYVQKIMLAKFNGEKYEIIEEF